MSNFQVLIVEDEPLYASNLEMLVMQLGYTCSGCVDNAEAALKHIKSTPPDLILMDINLAGEMDGINLALKIQQKQPIPTIFITSLQDDQTYKRAKIIQPYAFIGKPFDETHLQRTIELAVSRLSDAEETTSDWSQDVLFKDCIFVKVRQRLVKILFTDILYIAVEHQYCTVYISDKKYLVRMSLTDLLKRLPKQFLQTHRNFAVNAAKISSFDFEDMVVYVGEQAVALSRGYKNQLLERLEYL